MGRLLSFILACFCIFSTHVEAADNCVQKGLRSLLDKYEQSSSASFPLREVTFEVQVPNHLRQPSPLAVTRFLPAESMSPRLKELFAFTKENKIVITKGTLPQLASQNTTYIGIPPEALISEQALTVHLEKALVDYYNVPLNTERLPAQSLKLVTNMREKYNTRFISENEVHGQSFTMQNKIGIKTRHIDNLRVNGVTSHEITHNTTDRKVLEAFNPDLMKETPRVKRVHQPLTMTLSGREMNFEAKTGKKMQGLDPTYQKKYDSDEIEAHIRELAQGTKDNLDPEYTLKMIYSFIDSQEAQLKTLLKNNARDMSVVTAEAAPELLAGRLQRRLVTSKEADFDLFVLVPKNLSHTQEVKYIEETIAKRLETIRAYRLGLQRRYKPN